MGASRAERLYRAQHKLAKVYQFRDRDTKLCHGVTPTQCYALFELADSSSMTMAALARALGLEPSSMTRAVDDLVDRGLVRRREDTDDRRRCLVEMTRAGRELHDRILRCCIAREQEVLSALDPTSREDVVRAVELLAESVQQNGSLA